MPSEAVHALNIPDLLLATSRDRVVDGLTGVVTPQVTDYFATQAVQAAPLQLAEAAFPTQATLIIGLLGIVLSLPAWVFFIRGAVRLYRFIAAGRPDDFPRIDSPLRRLGTLVKEVALHTELARKPGVALAHWLVMVGFLLGFVVWFEAYIQTFNPHGGWPWLGETPLYHAVDEFLGVTTVLGIVALIIVRLRKPARFYGSNAKAAHFVEAVVLLEALGMLAVKAGKFATFDDLSPGVTDPVTGWLSQFLPASPLMVSVFALIKLLTGMIWLFIVGQQLTWGVAWHRFLAFFNIFFQRNPGGQPALGKLATPDLESEATVGVGHLGDASWKLLLDTATCTECGRCQDQCPAWNIGKPLSPKLFIRDIRDAAISAAGMAEAEQEPAPAYLKLIDTSATGGEPGILDPDVLWSCTNCGACVEQCPVDIEHIDHVASMRRFQVLTEANFPAELTSMFKNLEAKGNPWGRNSSERRTWIEEARTAGLTVPIVGEDAEMATTEYLLWVGCAGAFDEAGRATSRAIAELLETAGVSYATLAQGETCTGDPARRSGNEFLFQMLAQENVATINAAFEGIDRPKRTIITSCAHCFNTLRNEYPDFGGDYEVLHHTQVLNKLVREKLLTPVPRRPEDRQPITYHDPCFLGRHNKVFDPPRELLAEIAPLDEMPRNRNEGFCCGAGGGRMFLEENIGQRINENRAQEAIGTGAATIAVGCPFCNTMLGNGVKAVTDADPNRPQVKDVAVLLRDSILVDGKLPAPLPLRAPSYPRLSITPVQKSAKPATSKPPASAAASTAPQSPTPAVPAAPAAPGGTTPPAPSAAKPTTPAVPGAAIPNAPGASRPTPATPSAPGSSAPGGATPAAPGSSMPKAPGSAQPNPGTPPAPGAAVPGAVGLTPGTPPVSEAASPAAPSSATPAAPGTARPTPAVPAAPGLAQPKPAGPPAPGAAVPGTAKPTPTVPPAPGSASPAAPGAARPTPAVPPAPGAAVPGGARPTPAIPPTPCSAVPPRPQAPGGAKPTDNAE